MSQTFLGLNAASHDTGIAIVEDTGKISFAISEERLSRINKDSSFPRKSLNYAEKNFKVDEIVLPQIKNINFKLRALNLSLNAFLNNKSANIVNMWFNKLLKNNSFKIDEKTSQSNNFLKNKLKKSYIEHHHAHAASAYFHSGFKDSVILSLDGMGDLFSGGIYEGKNGNITRLKKFFIQQAPFALDYQLITTILGFKPNKHEGKITGLAAYGKHNERCIKATESFLNKVWSKNYKLNYDPTKNWSNNLFLSTRQEGIDLSRTFRNTIFKEFSREDLAYAIQYLTEKKVLNLIEKNISEIKNKNIALVGGLFANVKLNQRIKELEFRNIFIQPAMGDDGLSYGAVLWKLSQENSLKPQQLKDVYLGMEYSEDEIKKAISESKLKSDYYEEIEEVIAELISKNKIVARFNGRMEHGPRALGNRSILYQAIDPAINDWLNKRLNRSEFMPFAPVTLSEYANKCYKNLEGAEYAAKFMTITFDCTDYMKKNSPAVVHVDGTARPQLVSKEDNLSYYKIVKAYHKLTGIPSIVNTSFNMHEEPIVCTPEDAIRSFKEGHLDYLAIGNHLVKT